MKHRIIVVLAILALVGGGFVSLPTARAQTTVTGDVLVEGGYRLPRSHQYQTYDAVQGSYVNVDVGSVPGRLAAGQPIYDRTAQVWVSHPSVGGMNPMYVAGPSGQPPGDWQRVHGQVVSTSGSTLQFRTDDGRTLSVDMSQVGAGIQQALKPNEGATLIGFAGAQPNQFTARYIQQDSSNPARGGTVVGQTPPAPAGEQAWQRIHGTVASVSGTTLSLRTDDNRTITVDTKAVAAPVRQALKPGEAVTVIGFQRDDRNQVEARYIQRDSSAGAASPQTTK
jgi:hypothetical protein